MSSLSEWNELTMERLGALPVARFDPVEFPPIPGMEGPFQYKCGKVLYYDSREGKHYDRQTDLYVEAPEPRRRRR